MIRSRLSSDKMLASQFADESVTIDLAGTFLTASDRHASQLLRQRLQSYALSPPLFQHSSGVRGNY